MYIYIYIYIYINYALLKFSVSFSSFCALAIPELPFLLPTSSAGKEAWKVMGIGKFIEGRGRKEGRLWK
jgi:hypothetical protein